MQTEDTENQLNLPIENEPALVDVSPQPLIEPMYLGDGAYVKFDGYQLWVFTSDGSRIINQVALDRSVYYALTQYAKRLGFQTFS